MRKALIGLFALAMVVFLAQSPLTTLPTQDASTHAALSMSATAQGLIPHFPIGADAFGGHWGAGFNDHPFTFFYLSGWVMRALGPDSFSAKLVSSLFSVGCVLLTAWVGSLLGTELLGVLAALILVFSRLFIMDGLNGHLDNVMTFFILLSFAFWLRGWLWLAGIAAGLGLWFKSPIALLLFPTIVIFSALRGELKKQLRPLAILLFVALAMGSLVWIGVGLAGGWELVRDYWVRQVWGTAVGGRAGNQEQEYLIFIRVLRTHYLPWTLFLIWSLSYVTWLRLWNERRFLLPACAALIVIVVVSLMRFKYDHYLVPAYPFLALISALPLADGLLKHQAKVYSAVHGLALALALIFLCTPLSITPEAYPALRRFNALIQSYGSCGDRVLFVEGGQPYGTYDDYKALINFYTGRHVDRASCQSVQDAAQKESVAWVIVSSENLEKCLKHLAQNRFPKAFRYGNQYLLTRYGNASDPTDLTPLDRELKAVKDCTPAPLPDDRYHSGT